MSGAVVAVIVAFLAGLAAMLGLGKWRDRRAADQLDQRYAEEIERRAAEVQAQRDHDAAVDALMRDRSLSHDERNERLRAIVDATVARAGERR
jgi:hypothetical protein